MKVQCFLHDWRFTAKISVFDAEMPWYMWISAGVLIVPSWNWKDDIFLLLFLYQPSFNRTKLELKVLLQACCGRDILVLIVPSWNWKLIIFLCLHVQHVVLIVPSWNWKVVKSNFQQIQNNVLIVPSWNWKDTLKPFL